MAISKINPIVSASGPFKWSYTVPSANVPYGSNATMSAGFYTVTCVSTTNATVQFFSNQITPVAIATTVSGTVTVNVPVNCTRVIIWTNTGSNILVNVENTGKALSNDIGTLGSLETITSNTTYTNTSTSGYAFVIAVAGGGGGGGGGSNTGGPWLGATGGGSGGVACGIIQLTGSVPITIGTGGTGGPNQVNGNTGGSTTVGTLTATGGGGGYYARAGAGTPGGTGGTPGGVTAVSSSGTQAQGFNGAAGVNPYYWMTGSSVMGTGGVGVATNTAGGAGTLGGGGGGASSSYSNTGGAGGNGVVYIMRY